MIDLFMEYLEDTPSAIARLAAERPLGAAAAMVVSVLLSRNLAGLLVITPSATALLPTFLFGFLLSVLLALGLWVAWTALLHLFAEAWGGGGRAISLFPALGFTLLPLHLTLPLALLAAPLGRWKAAVMIPGGLLLAAWMVRLQILSLKQIYRLPGRSAGLVWAAPVVVGVVFLIGTAVVAALGVLVVLS